MGRPLKKVDGDMVQRLAGIGCINEEIATLVGCSTDTLVRRFADRLETGRARLKRSLRRKQVELARKGNVAILIWLGKNMLGQKDRQEIEHSGFASLYQDPLELRNGHGSNGRTKRAAGVAANGNGRSSRVPPPAAD